MNILRAAAIAASTLLLLAALALWAWTERESEMVERVRPATLAIDGAHRQSSGGFLFADEGVMVFWQEARLANRTRRARRRADRAGGFPPPAAARPDLPRGHVRDHGGEPRDVAGVRRGVDGVHPPAV
jgi:hypothetical protein